jgi:SulP family sulfate permease
MAYATLAGLPPIYGLYTAIIPPLVYAILGPSRHLSVGAFTQSSLLINSAVNSIYQQHWASGSEHGDSDLFNRIQLPLVLAISAMCGIMQLIMAAAQLGRLVDRWLLRPSLISGLTAGAAVLMVVSQLPAFFGITGAAAGGSPHQQHRRLFGMFWDLNAFTRRVATVEGQLNWRTAGFAVLCMLLITLLERLGERLQSARRRYPLPAVLLVSILSSLTVDWVGLDRPVERGGWGLAIIGQVPAGLAQPMLWPLMDLCATAAAVNGGGGNFTSSKILTGPAALSSCNWTALIVSMLWPAFTLASVSFVYSVAISRFYATQFNYQVSINRDLMALGVANLLGALLGRAFTSGGSLSRTAIAVKSGSRSQLSGALSALIVLAVTVWLTRFLYYIPQALLAAIVLLAANGLLYQLTEGWRLLKQAIHNMKYSHSRQIFVDDYCDDNNNSNNNNANNDETEPTTPFLDAAVWWLTFLGVIILNIEFGLVMGMLLCLMRSVYRSVKQTCHADSADSSTTPLLR